MMRLRMPEGEDYFLADFRTVAQTITAIPQTKSTPPTAGTENANAVAPSTRSQSPAVTGLIGRLPRSARSLF